MAGNAEQLRIPGVTLIDKLPIEGKRTFIRVDFNVPLEGDRVADDSRIRAAIPTIEHAISRGAKVILASHLGRPKGKPDPKYSMAPAGEVLAGLIGRDVLLADEAVGDGAAKLVRDMRDGHVVMLENLRFNAGEEKNEDSFARGLAAMTDVYVDDAFGAAHRAHASVAALPGLVEQKGAGFLMAAEVAALHKLVNRSRDGFVAVLGGAKVSDKIAVINKLVGRVDTLLIGGAMAYTFLAAQGHPVGKSKIEEDHLRNAREVLETAARRNVQVLLPIDHRGASAFDEKARATAINGVDIPEDLMGLDIGPRTAEIFGRKLREAKTIFWNGPMGVFEWKSFAEGTMAVANAVADSKGYSLVGGGDSVRAVNESGRDRDIGHISTGGGASLEFVEGRELPGLKALGYYRR
jgi:phosphoglycerate kinase